MYNRVYIVRAYACDTRVNEPITTCMYCNSTDAKRDKRNREATKPNMGVFWGYKVYNIFLTFF